MSRKVVTFVVPGEGRDAGKHFVLTEMDAVQGEKWALRALGAMARSGVQLPEGALTGGFGALLAIGIQAITAVHFDEAEPLLDEMMACARFQPDASKPGVTRPINAGGSTDIEETKTIFALRGELIELHTGFSIADALSSFGASAKTVLASNDTPTSPNQSLPSSEADLPA